MGGKSVSPQGGPADWSPSPATRPHHRGGKRGMALHKVVPRKRSESEKKSRRKVCLTVPLEGVADRHYRGAL